MSGLAIEIREPDADLTPHWRDLVERARTNVFMDPVGLKAAHDSGFDRPLTLLAWDTTTTPARLAGLWALRPQRTFGLPWRHLHGLPHDYAFLSSPVVDPDRADEVIAAFFSAIIRRSDLPKVVRLRYLDGGDRAYAAIADVLASHGFPSVVLGERQRPFATRESGVKRSGSTRKKLRQDWNRLSAAGTVEVVNDRDPTAAAEGLEIFLAMEAASWKGGHGTAFLSTERDAAFVRHYFSVMAAAGDASVALLRVDDAPIAAQVLLYSGATAYTWKTAYDAAFGRFSPGALLVDKVTDMLLASGAVTAIESCSPEGGFMGQIWSGRRPTLDLLVELGQRRSLTFLALVAGVRAHAGLKALRTQLRAGQWPWKRATPTPTAAEIPAKT